MSGPVHLEDRRPPRPVFVRRFALAGTAPARPHAVAHGHMGLAFYLGGSAEVEQRGRLRLAAGDVHLVPAGEAHRLLHARGVEGLALGFDRVGLGGSELAGLLAPFERARDGAAAVVSIPASRQEHLRGLLGELQRETEAPGLVASSVQRSLLTLALAEVARAAHSDDTPVAGPPLVVQALRLIERRCLGPLSLSDVAAALQRSPAHLTTAVRLATGRTVQQWISALRLAEARRRLLAGDESIEAIAARVGDLDPTHFIRMFRRAHGHTPAAWRTLQRAG